MRYVWFLLFMCFCEVVLAQNSTRVQELEKQRKEALAEVERINGLIDQTQATTKDYLRRLNLLSEQILSRKKVISLLGQEVEAINMEMREMSRQIRRLEGELEEKQQNYGKSVRSMYRRQASQDKLLFILSAENFAQSLRRLRYLREYAAWQKRQASEIVEKQTEITQKRNALTQTRQEKQQLLAQQERERKQLQSEETNQQKEVKMLNKKKSQLQAQLREKQKQAQQLDRLIQEQIAREIAEANKKKAADKQRQADVKGGYAMTKVEKALSDNFAANRGRLPYPVAGSYTIISRFGEQQHEQLKYVRTNNNGIDIQTAPGTDARAVFKGVVTRIFTVPGFNHSIIVRHGNYLTVYSNLSQVYVKTGDHVDTRQALGRIFSDPEESNATILHFQLWKEKTKLNPVPWLD
ncbi:peptidase M24 [Parabacteroides sp. An277]|uniref:murein hydrolase activator EnvC family protein n=1 Tax=Parabacteroides sp. An277 TaxID=1965619 RepID=UPI000B381A2E|nr:peptidoglycan DD-metalloendopeptidase family protein [Parabacteroides sp. An277]OUO49650.1 peptidase M24 [Parabacteroides sp. An277]